MPEGVRPTVIVTRPQPQAQTWVEALRAAGCNAHALPLIEIAHAAPTPELLQRLAGWLQCRAVMFVSAPAVAGFFNIIQPQAQHSCEQLAIKTRAWATGPGTRAALLAQGWPPDCIDAPDAQAGQFDSEALWALVAAQVHPGDRVLIVRGRDEADPAAAAAPQADEQGAGRHWLAEQAQARGAAVSFAVTYARRPPRWDAQAHALATQAAQGAIWLFSSSEAVRQLTQRLPTQDWRAARALATHERIAQAARAAGFGQVQTTQPALDAVLASIEFMR